ncbi:MAG: hypothetical protein M3M88_00840 [Thermoproteota archaeon]|nr:hypothetical protein [Thermoproteota archaeon]
MHDSQDSEVALLSTTLLIGRWPLLQPTEKTLIETMSIIHRHGKLAAAFKAQLNQQVTTVL